MVRSLSIKITIKRSGLILCALGCHRLPQHNWGVPGFPSGTRDVTATSLTCFIRAPMRNGRVSIAQRLRCGQFFNHRSFDPSLPVLPGMQKAFEIPNAGPFSLI
jgi:hypothetical protein